MIRRFDEAAPERQGRVLRLASELGLAKGDVRRLQRCDASEFCPKEHAACRVCSFKAAALAQTTRNAFRNLVALRCSKRWSMLVVVPEYWQLPLGRLSECDPEKFLEAVVRRLRRTVPDVAVVVALDVCLNQIEGPGKARGSYWAAHLNILAPTGDIGVIRRALSPIYRSSPQPDPGASSSPPAIPATTPVLRTTRRREITDPWVGANYAIKFDVSAVRARVQKWNPAKGRFLMISGWKGRLDEAAFREFLAWRLTFRPSSLVALRGIKRSRKRWRILRRAEGP
jgi:hypothetical protein